jgi:4-hydroxyphenylacetate 3-monooxygenase
MAIRTGAQYRDSIRDGREVWIDGERVQDVTKHPIFRPIIDVRARIYDMAHEAAHRELLTYEGSDAVGRNSVFGKPPVSQDDWHKKRAATDAVFDEVGGIVNRIGEETIAELWSLHDGRDLLNEVDPRFAANIDRHVESARCDDLFWVSANTDPKGDRAKMPAEKDPDLMLRAVRETDAGIVVRGAKFETGVAYANRAFVKPTIAQWGDDALSDYAVGFVVDLAARGVRMRLSTVEPLRRNRQSGGVRRRADSLGGRAVLSPHASCKPGSRHPASIWRICVRATLPANGGPDDRRRPAQRQADGPRVHREGAGAARHAGDLP